MNRSELLNMMRLGRGGVAAGARLGNRWQVHHGWSDAARAASLDVRRAKAALRQAQDAHRQAQGGGAASRTDVSAINLAPDGKTYVGFTDSSVEPPRNHYLPVGGEEDGWKVVSADYDSEEVVLEKDGERTALTLGGGGGSSKVLKFESAGVEDGGTEDGVGGTGEDGGGEVDLGDAWEDFQESGIWSMDGRSREEILADIRERYGQEGDEALEHGERKFLEQYGKWESVQNMAGMIVEGGGGEPPPFAETQARLRGTLDDPAATDADRGEAQLVYRAEMEAARRIWEAKAGQAYYTKYGRSADTEAEAREGEELAGVPAEYEGSLADGYLENRRACGRRRRELANRVEEAARGRLANTGWTDAAREVSLRVRRDKARIRALLKDRPDGTSYRDAGGTWIKRGGDVELVRVDGVYAAGQNKGRLVTELAAGRRGDFFDPYSKGTVNAMERFGYLTPAQGAAARAVYGYGDTENRATHRRCGALANVGWTDEARAASLLARQAKAVGSGAGETETGKSTPPSDHGRAGSAGIRAEPERPYVKNGLVMKNIGGKDVVIGKEGVIVINADGSFSAKVKGRIIPLVEKYDLGRGWLWRPGQRLIPVGDGMVFDLVKGGVVAGHQFAGNYGKVGVFKGGRKGRKR